MDVYKMVMLGASLCRSTLKEHLPFYLGQIGLCLLQDSCHPGPEAIGPDKLPALTELPLLKTLTEEKAPFRYLLESGWLQAVHLESSGLFHQTERNLALFKGREDQNAADLVMLQWLLCRICESGAAGREMHLYLWWRW